MRRNFTLVLSLFFFSFYGQDSLKIKRLGLYDCTLYAAFDFIQNESKVNLPFIQSFTEDRRHSFNNLSFPDTVSYSLYSDPHGETDGGEFGLNFTFRFKQPGKKLFARLRPRAGFFYSYKQFFTYNVHLTGHTITDTISKNSPDSYTLKDSVLLRNLIYSYYSEQLYLQLGCNYEVFQSPRYNAYTGVLLNAGVSIKNEFSTQIFDTQRDDLISSSGDRTEGSSRKLQSSTYSSTESLSHSFRLGVPIGLSVRFMTREKFSLGLMLEGRLAVEHYQIDRGRSVNYLLFALGAGLRFSFYPHRQEG